MLCFSWACFRRWLTSLFYMTGLGLSGYALFVEVNAEKDPENYKAICDFDDAHSCTTVFRSKYGKGFGVIGDLMGDQKHPLNQPNSVYGLVFYSLSLLLFVCAGQRSKIVAELLFYMTILSNFMSCYLGYLLYAVLKNLCYVCVATYAVNFLLLVFLYFNRRHLRNKIVPEYSRFGKQSTANFNLPQYDFKKNI